MKSSTRRRRTHSPEFKAKLVAECQQPGASIAAIALAHRKRPAITPWLRVSNDAAAIHEWRKHAEWVTVPTHL